MNDAAPPSPASTAACVHVVDDDAAMSQREQQVMVAVANGRMNKQVAFDLGLSEMTIRIHRRNAMRRMGARDLAGFVKMSEALTAVE